MKILLSSLTLLLLLGGCGEKQEENASKASTTVATASSIEVSKNDEAYKEKVEAHDVGTDKDRSFYYDYHTDKPGEEVKPRTAVDANMRVRSPYEEVQIGMLVGKLSKEYIVKCSACHDDYANGVIGPSLLGKDADFIFKKIQTFKTDPDANVLMTGLVRQMSDDEIRTLAKEIERFNAEIAEMNK